MDLALDFAPRAFLRMTPLAYKATPLGMGYGHTRFASPNDRFQVLYIAADLVTSIAETIIRDRFEGRQRRRISRSEVERWGITEVTAIAPLRVVDLRTTGLLRLGVSTNAAHGKSHQSGRRLSAAIYSQRWPDGILYHSRLTGVICCAVYDRGVAKLSASQVVDAVTLAALSPALRRLTVELVA